MIADRNRHHYVTSKRGRTCHVSNIDGSFVVASSDADDGDSACDDIACCPAEVSDCLTRLTVINNNNSDAVRSSVKPLDVKMDLAGEFVESVSGCETVIASSAPPTCCCGKSVAENLLIFTMGSLTYTPHQVGIKHITSVQNQHDADSSLKRANDIHDPGDDDNVDHVIELHGHIIGMNLSPDHRFLYVNSRPWPKDYKIKDPLSPPPIAQEIDISVIDLVLMTLSGKVLRSHKAFTSNEECFFIFLDVSMPYVASGAEDRHGYLWDRHYGVCLAKYEHTDVVNCVAFNPCDPETLVTVSDDFTIKVWRSKRHERQLKAHPTPCDKLIPR
jgi:F-box/WD-40 domain protein 5